MIRFIDIGGQINEGDHDFAWFNTIIDRFHEYNGTHVWSSWEEFVADHKGSDDYPLERYEALFPNERRKDMTEDEVVGTANPETVAYFKEHLMELREVELEIEEAQRDVHEYLKVNGKFGVLSRYIALYDKMIGTYEKRAKQYSKEIMESLGTFSKMLGDQFGIAPAGKLYHLDPDTGVVTLVGKPGGSNVNQGS